MTPVPVQRRRRINPNATPEEGLEAAINQLTADFRDLPKIAERYRAVLTEEAFAKTTTYLKRAFDKAVEDAAMVLATSATPLAPFSLATAEPAEEKITLRYYVNPEEMAEIRRRNPGMIYRTAPDAAAPAPLFAPPTTGPLPPDRPVVPMQRQTIFVPPVQPAPAGDTPWVPPTGEDTPWIPEPDMIDFSDPPINPPSPVVEEEEEPEFPPVALGGKAPPGLKTIGRLVGNKGKKAIPVHAVPDVELPARVDPAERPDKHTGEIRDAGFIGADD